MAAVSPAVCGAAATVAVERSLVIGSRSLHVGESCGGRKAGASSAIVRKGAELGTAHRRGSAAPLPASGPSTAGRVVTPYAGAECDRESVTTAGHSTPATVSQSQSPSSLSSPWASSSPMHEAGEPTSRRSLLSLSAVLATMGWMGPSGTGLFVDRNHTDGMAMAASLPPTDDQDIRLCNRECERDLEGIPTVTMESGLQFKDIVAGKGPQPPIGFQVAAHYVAMLPDGKVFDSSLEKGMPYIIRLGARQVIAGLDEGVQSMKVGGKRRLYIPGNLAFPKGLASAPGRPRVAANSPVVFDVQLLYVPGLEDIEEE
ncbi:hypothetical protein CBR_g49189 [Chara braunii]|uniref:peptidylprolyl isomerase n=1 Tax=Chara braunii TaxID=69332 RepID=A0A388M481_CHABU|nr:hypothetical protein CBR_g49189 [Chara braunii]|eukprot:GBG89398.1 hypothetical protein CBR_g49189 [Chara braunii]